MLAVAGLTQLGSVGTYRDVGRHSIDVDVVEGYVLSPNKECSPAGRIFKMETRNFDVGSVVGEEEDWAVVFVVWVENFGAGEAIPPCLAIAVDDAGTVYLDIPKMLSAWTPTRRQFMTYFPPQTQKVMLFWKS